MSKEEQETIRDVCLSKTSTEKPQHVCKVKKNNRVTSALACDGQGRALFISLAEKCIASEEGGSTDPYFRNIDPFLISV